MDEQLIAEVQLHGVIYNRQKYFMSQMGGSVKYESKEDAWQVIALKLGSDVDTCKKRWKYLRERYVSQRKQSDPPVYEHLSRPYLEKMKFLDQHITPRKSYRNVAYFETSPNAGGNYHEFNMDSSKSNGSPKSGGSIYSSHHENMHNQVKMEPDHAFADFSGSVLSPNFPQINASMSTPHNSTYQNLHLNSNCYDRLPENDPSIRIPSSSSSLKSTPSASSTIPENDAPIDCNKKPRVQGVESNINTHRNDESSDDNDGYIDEPLKMSNSANLFRATTGHHPVESRPMYQTNDMLYSLYNQLSPHSRQVRSSEHLVGELVTSELLKMSKERRKSVQKRILEILFFDD